MQSSPHTHTTPPKDLNPHGSGSSPHPTHLVEFLVAVGTLVLLVGVVGLQVPHFRGGIGEGTPAVVALVRFLPAVDQLVPFEVAGGGEELAAVVAAVFGLPRVPFLVEVQQADEAVALPALLAAVGLQRAAEETGPSQRGKRTSAPSSHHPDPSSTTPVRPARIPEDVLKQRKREGQGQKDKSPPGLPHHADRFFKDLIFCGKSRIFLALPASFRDWHHPNELLGVSGREAERHWLLYRPLAQTLTPSASHRHRHKLLALPSSAR